jgi:hypothetical protein
VSPRSFSGEFKGTTSQVAPWTVSKSREPISNQGNTWKDSVTRSDQHSHPERQATLRGFSSEGDKIHREFLQAHFHLLPALRRSPSPQPLQDKQVEFDPQAVQVSGMMIATANAAEEREGND